MRLLCLLLITVFLFCSSCEKEETIENDVVLDSSYEGWLDINYTNLYPEWNVSKRLEATIDKTMGTILFETGTMIYSGETIISDDSKIERSGSWNIEPFGFLKSIGTDISIETDGNVTVQNDIQRIYGKNNAGEWVVLNETDFSSTPDAQLVFSLNEALINGSVVKVSAEGGSISWSLYLVPTLVD